MSDRPEKEIVEEIARHSAAISACTAELARIHRADIRPRKQRKLTPPAQLPSDAVMRTVATKLRRIG